MIKYNEESLKTEKDVEYFYWYLLKTFFPKGKISSEYKTDGIFIDDENKLKILLEIKYDLDMTKSSDRAKVISQIIFYLKKFEIKGNKIPKLIFIGDKNECFVLHTNSLLKYLDYDIDWNIAPSHSYIKYPDMMFDITNDKNIKTFIFDLRYKKFNFNAIKNKIIDLNKNVIRLIKITDNNIQSVFDYFKKNVLKEKNLNINDEVNLFIDIIINSDENYLHPKKKNTLMSKSLGFVKVDEKNFISFFEHFDGQQYTVREKEKMVSIIDRLIEDETRKRQGEFFTPNIWVDEAHKMITEQFGEDWKKNYIVWDCAWGTGNLTRDYKFKKLFCSTLHQGDIDTANQMKINQEAVKFQFDFLNDDLELLKEPDYAPELYDMVYNWDKYKNEYKGILFFINPPYGTASIKSKKSKKGISDTTIVINMKEDNWGASTQQLYAQFLYKITQIQKENKNVKIGLFSPPLFLSGCSYKKFRKEFFKYFSFKTGYLINANNFADVKNWGLSFTLFEYGYEKYNEYTLIKKELNENLNIVNNKKLIYNLDNKISLNDFCRKKIRKTKKYDNITLKSALNFSKKIKKIPLNTLSIMVSDAINIEKNTSGVMIINSQIPSNNGNFAITKTNILNSILTFTARKIIKPTWVNQKDEYIAPTEKIQQTTQYKQFNNDAIVYSLFNTSSNQSSMRQIEYKDKLWDIKNEFFWLSKEIMMNLADEHYFNDLYQDVRNSNERFVHKLLSGNLSQDEFKKVNLTLTKDNKPLLSPDAQELLDLSQKLIIKSFKYRKLMHEEYPEYHLNTWDAGWYQIKKILNMYMKEDLKKFNDKYKIFENRLRPQVYELGFLLK